LKFKNILEFQKKGPDDVFNLTPELYKEMREKGVAYKDIKVIRVKDFEKFHFF